MKKMMFAFVTTLLGFSLFAKDEDQARLVEIATNDESRSERMRAVEELGVSTVKAIVCQF